MTQGKGINKSLAGLMIPALLWLFFSSTSYWHYHISPYGEVIRHSHPYAQSSGSGEAEGPFQTHQHSQAGYICLEQITKTSATQSAPCQNIVFFEPEPEIRELIIPSPPLSRPLLPKNILRGPPSLS